MSEPIRILHVLQRMEAGGTQALLMNLYMNIDRKKVQFDFLVEYPNKEFYDDEIVKLGGRVYYSDVRISKNIFKFRKILSNLLKNNDYNIIHVHAYTIGFFAFQVAKKYKIPVRIAHSHNNQTVKDKFYLLKLFMQKIYTKYATDLFACSKDAGNYLFKNKEFLVLNNCIDSKKFIFNKDFRDEIRKELNIENCFVVGHVGRLHQQKNHLFLLNVFKEIKNKKGNAKLLLVGSGPLENKIKNYVNELGLNDDVIFLGVRQDVYKILMSFDVFILPSLFEGLGIVAIESQAAGTPIIISNGVPDSAILTPICKKVSLSESYEEWASDALLMADNEDSHKNMQQFIIDGNFDLQSSVKWLENYYIKKSK